MKETNKDKILEAATLLFLEKGFSGSSISQIAKQAGVAKSLVFHHYPTKEELWRTVKASLLQHIEVADMQELTYCETLEAFIENVVGRRFRAYEGNPRLARLFLWQQLEPDADKLIGVKQYRSDAWEKAIKDLQKRTLINPNYPPDVISSIIYGAISNVFFDYRKKLFENPKKLNAYKNCVIESLIKGLRP